MEWLEDDNMLIKDFEFKDFKKAIVFVIRVARIAEKIKHHPNILIHEYNHVRITLQTHDVGKVTEKDHELSKLIDKIQM